MSDEEALSLTKLHHDIRGLRNDLTNLGKIEIERIKEVEDVAKKVDRILLLLIGDELESNNSYKNRLEKLEKIIEKFEKLQEKLSGSIATVLFFLTALGAVVTFAWKLPEWIEWFKKHWK
jgi:hypothetical protein